MNLTTLKTATSRGLLILKKYSPEILTGVGIVTNVLGTVMACRATTHLERVLDDHHADMIDLKDQLEYEGNDLDEKREKTKIYFHTVGKIAKLYAPAVAINTISIVCSFGSHKILKDRNVALMTAYSSLATAYNDYRQRVIDEYGEQKDEDYRLGVTQKEVTEIGKNGKEKTVVIDEADIAKGASPYARCFDELNPNYQPRADLNLMFLRNMQNWANDKLVTQGHLFLNEVYEMLGFDHTSAGAVVGWIAKKDEQVPFVDFGIYNLMDPTKRRFINGDESAVWLDFNVDGVIYNLI